MAQTDQTRYQRRNQLARQRGFKSYGQQRRYARTVSSEQQLRNLPADARMRRAEVLDVIGAARRDRVPLAEAAAARHVPMSAVVWWGEPALDAARSRAPKVRPGDRILRAHVVAVDGRLQIITTRGSHAAERAREAARAQRAFMADEPGAAEMLATLQGVRVGGQLIETDPDTLGEIGRRGEWSDIAEMYRAWSA